MTLFRTALALLLIAAAACNDTGRQAMGDVHGVIVVAENDVWAQVEDTVMTILQPRIFAVRDEATFRLTQVSPTHPHWGDLRRFRQILAIGSPSDPWVAEPLRQAGAGDAPLDGGRIVEADNVWARNQRVTALVVPEGREAMAVAANVDSVARLLDSRYRHWAVDRMFTSGLNTDLVTRLEDEAGFTLRVPNVYRWRALDDSTYMFINDQPDASQLVRSLLVTSRPAAGEAAPTVDGVVAWRDETAARYYDWGMETERERFQPRRLEGPGAGGLEVRGVWLGTLDDFPQAGPFITRVIDCPVQDRRYLLDTWLYAPARDKYQYMIQLETLLDSFRCAPGGA
jgi:hypothetical protein